MKDQIGKWLDRFKEGSISKEELIEKLKKLPFEDLGFAKIDHHRELRHGFPEVIFGSSKSTEQLESIVKNFFENNRKILITRLPEDKASYLKNRFPELNWFPEAKLMTFPHPDEVEIKSGKVIPVVCAGTSDYPVAMEAYITGRMLGNRMELITDVGVAGIHRITPYLDLFNSARIIIVVAGMEGALPSVIAGMVSKPVVAVPTSVGYGASFGGLSALLAMLNSCVSSVVVVNIDNGFGAAYFASMINRED